MIRFGTRSFGALALGGLMLMTLGAAPASAAAPRTLMVDADGHAGNGNCDAANAAFSTIQSAIAAAHHGDTVKVCPGDYTENLVIRAARDHVTIIGTKPWAARIWRPVDLPAATPLVEIKQGATHVTFRHFSLVFPTTNDCDAPSVDAILVSGTHAHILGNRIHTDGVDNQSYTCGFQTGIAVGFDEGVPDATDAIAPAGASAAPISAVIGWNTIRNFDLFGIGVAGAATSATVKRNSVHFGHRGTDECPTSITSTSNVMPALGHAVVPSGLGICLAGGVFYADSASGKVIDNVVMSDFDGPDSAASLPAGLGGPAPLMYFGISNGLFDSGGAVSITRNVVRFNALGVTIADGAGTRVQDNEVDFTLGYAIGIDEGSGVAVKHNQVLDGDLFADSDTSGNVFRGNTVNSGDCEDDSTGTDTSGTANHWVGNTADTSTPIGICATAP